MKNLFIFTLVLIFATTICSTIQAENAENPTENPNGEKTYISQLHAGVGIVFFKPNSDFQSYVSEQFKMDLPSVRFDIFLMPSFYLGKQQQWAITVGWNTRLTQQSKNDAKLFWYQNYLSIDLSHVILKNENFQLSPFAGISVCEDMLYYKGNVNNLETVPEVLASPYRPLQLYQGGYGLEAGLRFDVKKRTEPRPLFSFIIKYEQAIFINNWKLDDKRMRDIPKLRNNGVSFSIFI